MFSIQSPFKDKLRTSFKIKKTLEALHELEIEGALNRLNNYVYRRVNVKVPKGTSLPGSSAVVIKTIGSLGLVASLTDV